MKPEFEMSLPQEKSFADPQRYLAEIRQLVPGYDALQESIGPVGATWVETEEARVLVVGCGPGQEIVNLANVNPRWMIDAIDPEPKMVAGALEVVRRTGLDDRVSVRRCTLSEATVDDRYDLTVCLLVGHLIADDGERETFVSDLARSLRPGGVLILAELVDRQGEHSLHSNAHLLWAQSAGLSEGRCGILDARLNGGFAMLNRARLDHLLETARVRGITEFFLCLTVVGLVGRKERCERRSKRSTAGPS